MCGGSDELSMVMGGGAPRDAWRRCALILLVDVFLHDPCEASAIFSAHPPGRAGAALKSERAEEGQRASIDDGETGIGCTYARSALTARGSARKWMSRGPEPLEGGERVGQGSR